MKPQIPSPHCRPPAEDDLDDRVCSCSPEPYWIEWLEEQEQKEKDQDSTSSANTQPEIPTQKPDLPEPSPPTT